VADGVETDRDAIGDSVMAEALAELQREVTELATVAAAAKGELAAELRRSSDLAAALSKAEARADRLEAALAEARRPWLAKVIEGLRRKGS
jgi:chromosome segregation ATPase